MLGFLHHRRAGTGQATMRWMGIVGMIALAFACCGSFWNTGEEWRRYYSPFAD